MKPEAQAERLLWEVLPKDLYFHYAAFGWFTVNIDGRSYYLYKNAKTQSVDQDGSHLSWCIHSSRKVPDQDRLVSEYLLLTNNEAEYLRTANGTVINGPPARPSNYDIAMNTLIGTFMVGIVIAIATGLTVGFDGQFLDAFRVPALPPIAISPSVDPHMISGAVAYQELYMRGYLVEKPPGWKEDKAVSYKTADGTHVTITSLAPISGVLNHAVSDEPEDLKPAAVSIPECLGRRICSLSSTEFSVFSGVTTSGTVSVAWGTSTLSVH